MRAALSDAGIEPGDDLRQVLREAGFKTVHTAREEDTVPERELVPDRGVRELGPPRGVPAFIQRFLDRWRSGDTSEGETEHFVAEVRSMRAPPRGLFVNLLA